ncbi:MAG: hypothetical protein ACL7BU_09100 [Candidatus Phlomobacter fragariae]
MLNADNNRLTFLPDSLSASLTNLIVSNNQLIVRPDHIPNKLIRFNFTGNQLSAESTHLPINLSLAGSSWDYAILTSDRNVSDWQISINKF